MECDLNLGCYTQQLSAYNYKRNAGLESPISVKALVLVSETKETAYDDDTVSNNN